MIRISHWLPAIVLLILGCSSEGDKPDPNTGSVTLALQSNGVQLTHITYTITGVGFTRISDVNVEHSTTISALIGGLPVGSYQVELQATDAQDPTIACTGSGAFQIFAHETTSTRVNLYCSKESNTGSVAITGDVERCPTIRAISAEPAEANVGHTITLYANQDDAGVGLVYSWNSSGGSLSDAFSSHPTLTCTAPGPVSIRLALTSADGACSDIETVTVMCSYTSPDDPNPLTPGDDRAGYTACVSESCGPGSVCCPTIGVCAAKGDDCPSDVQTCDGPEDCPVPGEQCVVQLHGMNCGVPVPNWGILCHSNANCVPSANPPNPCSSVGQWGQCRVVH